MHKGQKILIVSYHIPPYGGIGGRRWCKFGIQLLAQGYDVAFLAAEPEKSGLKRWESDYDQIKDRLSYFPSQYPPVLKGKLKGLFDKIKYRLEMRKIKKREKGNYFDHSCLDREVLQAAITQKIKAGYETVISTGAPFCQLYYIAELREAQKNFRFIADFRDPWTMQDWSYGFQTLSEERKAFEKEKEAFVLNHADEVITVLPRMTADFQLTAKFPEHVHTIYNGFDEAEFAQQAKTKNNSGIIKFVFAGNFYDNAVHHIMKLVKALHELKIQKPDIYKRIKMDFYGHAPAQFHEAVHGLNCIQHHGFIPSSEVRNKLQEADLGMLFLIDGFNYSLSTKFFEYIAQDKAIFLCAKKGESSSFITNNKIGWHFEAHRSLELFEEIAAAKEADSISLDTHFDKAQFSISTLSQKVEAIIRA